MKIKLLELILEILIALICLILIMTIIIKYIFYKIEPTNFEIMGPATVPKTRNNIGINAAITILYLHNNIFICWNNIFNFFFFFPFFPFVWITKD